MTKRNFLIIVGIILAFASCTENRSVENGNQMIFDHYEKNVQTFILSSDKPETIIGEEGTKITIDINSLELENGIEISENVIIQLTEYYKPSDVILANLSTSSNGKLIETGGMINISASSSGKEVFIKKGKDFEIQFSSVEQDGMKVFHGEYINGQINWKPETKPTQISKAGLFAPQDESSNMTEALSDTTAVAIISETDSIARNNILNSTKFGWINCDRFLELDNLTTLKVEYDSVFKPSAYLVFKEINSIMPCFYEKNFRKFINLPKGYEATLIAFCIDGDKTYFSFRDLIIEDKKQLSIEFKEVSLNRIKKEIEKIIEQ
jgi:hypothetical protein